MYYINNRSFAGHDFNIKIGDIRLSFSSLFSFFIASLCALYLSSAPIDIFPDRHNYLDYAEWKSLAFLAGITDRPLWLVMFSEPVWHILNIYLGAFFSPEMVVRIIIFIPAFLLYFIASKYFSSMSSFGLLFLFLLFSLHPIYLSNHFHHLRFAIALSFFVLAFNIKNYKIKCFFLFLSPLVHVSFYVFLMLFLFSYISDKFKNKIIVVSFLVVSISVFIVYLLGLSEDIAITQLHRYSEREVDVGGGMFIVMFSILIIMIAEGKRFLSQHMIAVSFLCLYIFSYWVFPYSRRFLDAGLWFILIAGLSLSGVRRYAFVAVFGAVIVAFLLRTIHLPYFGYAYDYYYD